LSSEVKMYMGKQVAEAVPLLRVNGLKKYFPIQRGLFRKTVGHVKAVDDVSFDVAEGETLGIVGESGCGKTTTGRCIPRLVEPTEGEVLFRRDKGVVNIVDADKAGLHEIRREIQTIFQDPMSSLNPRMSVRDIISEPLRVNGIGTRRERTEAVEEAMARVSIRPEYMNRFPHQFSGGQRQRIGIARSLILKPRLIICDEAVSALDVSIQAQVINMLMDLQKDLKFTYLFIAHDLSVVEHICDRVVVMYLGKVVETGPTERLYQRPRHPYTEALLYSIPMADPLARRRRAPLEGDVPDPSNPPKGCYFHTRCPYATDLCRREAPPLVPLKDEPSRMTACHRVDEIDLKGFDVIRDDRRSADAPAPRRATTPV
jgi:oligopeptide/dipeptide ABC transporter ATP-binding protein